MVHISNALALLKALVVAAWADDTFSQSEMNYIKELARRFDLDDDDWFALQPYLEDSPNEEEREAILRDLLSRIGSASERQAVISHIEGVIAADSHISPEETELLRRYEEVLNEPSSLDLMVRRLKGLFQSQPPHSHLNVDEFLRNKILFKLHRRTDTSQITPDMHRLALLGGLMGIVAHADHDIHERELVEIRNQLEARGRFDDDAMEVLLAIIHEESVRGLDRHRLIAEYTNATTLQDRVELLDLLFGVAAADGGLTHNELEELRAISSALHLSHKQYINAKLRTKKEEGRS
jgi:uncharacterized tellurite resistance protein B-like protein